MYILMQQVYEYLNKMTQFIVFNTCNFKMLLINL